MLSVSKLQDFLASKGYIPVKYFVMDGYCYYIELFSIKTSDIFLLYIPSKYNIKIKNIEGMYKIRFVDIRKIEDIADEYTGKPDDTDSYKMNIQISDDKEKLQDHLESNYKHLISLKDMNKDDLTELRSVYRQVRRLKYCVQNLKYKLGIQYKNYICTVKKNDSIDCFSVKNYNKKDEKKLLIIVDLETFYGKESSLINDINIVRSSIYSVIGKNYSNHGKVLTKIMENKQDILDIPVFVENKTAKYEEMIKELEDLLGIMTKSEDRILEQLRGLEIDDRSNGTHVALQNDINRVHTKTRLDRELDVILSIKKDITKTMADIRINMETSIINVDKIMFDNNVMIDAIIKNFAKLKDYC
jgi:hypothetical protein